MKPSRRRSFVLRGGALLGAPALALAQPAGKVHHVAHLSGSGALASKPFLVAFRDGMRALGHVETRDFVLQERYAEGKGDRLPALARELLEQRPDVLLVSTTPASLAAKAASTTVPMVVVLVADPVGAGIVQSLARPGGNITGITNIVAELAGKRLELLKELVPGARRVAVFINPDSQNAPLQMRNAQAAASRLGIELSPVLEIRKPADLEPAFEAAVRARAGAAIRMIDPLVFMLREQTAALSIKHHLPVIYPSREDVEAGGLVSYGTNVPEQYRQAAGLVDKLLKGAKPADLPVEQPTRFELAINLKTARALGVTVSQAMRVRADEVTQ